MKTAKRVFAVVVAVLLIAMMIPAASAANVSFKLGYDGDAAFTFDVYKLATLNETTGAYTKDAGTANSVFSKITDPASDTAALLAACDALAYADPAAGFGTKVAAYDPSTDGAVKEITQPAGIYYVKANKPSTVKSVTNSIVALPYVDANGNKKTDLNGLANVEDGVIKLASKVSAGTEFIRKEIVNGKIDNRNTTAELNEYVQFKLTASVVGSTDAKLTAFNVADKMDAGLTFVNDANHPVTVKLTGQGLDDQTLAAADFEVKDAPTFKSTAYTFAVSLNSNILDATKKFITNTKTFYDFTNVEVTCYAKLNDSAKFSNEGSNDNRDDLYYTNDVESDHKVEGNDVHVYTFKVKVRKVDADNTDNGLAGATFAIYDNDAATGTPLATATTVNGGYATFNYKFDQNKTYYLKETKAPDGYNLNTSILAVKTDAAATVAAFPADGVLGVDKAFTDTKSVLPQTGGTGTLVFTIVGGSLVLLAAALFIIVMKKRSSAK